MVAYVLQHMVSLILQPLPALLPHNDTVCAQGLRPCSLLTEASARLHQAQEKYPTDLSSNVSVLEFLPIKVHQFP